jgi:hypothetical protein
MGIRFERSWPFRAGLRLFGAAAVMVVVLVSVSCSKSSSAAPPSSTGVTPSVPTSVSSTPSHTPAQSPVPPENNPPGDIPDTTVYVPYVSTIGHFTINVPEGWSRRSQGSSVMFASNLNSITVAWAHASTAPTVASTKSTVVPQLRASMPAFQLQSVNQVSLQGGSAIETIYQVNSAPNPVTGRQYRLVIERFELFSKGRVAVISLSSAVGSDNVDPWRIVSESFRWS